MKTLGNFQLFAEIKRSATGATYRGLDRRTQQLVLVKTFITDDSASAAATRFEQEAAIYARLSHPNLVKLIAYGTAEGLRYLTLEYLEGRTLRSLLQHSPHGGKLPVTIALTLFDNVLAGVAEIHRHHFIHRDLKPENILIGHDGCVKLCDFDLATSHAAQPAGSGLTGSPGYLAPEIILGEKATPAIDLFALGILLYEMLAGARPFQSTSAGGEINAIVRVAPLPITTLNPHAPAVLDELFAHLLAKKPAMRPNSAENVRSWLAQHFVLGTPETQQQRLREYLAAPENWPLPAAADFMRAEPPASPPSKPGIRRRWLAASASLMLALLLAYWGFHARTGEAPQGKTVQFTTAPLAADSLQPVHTLPKPQPQDNAAAASAPTVTPVPPAAPPAVDSAGVPPSRMLYIQSNPWAYVFVDDDSLGMTPLATPLSLSPGVHALILKNPKFPPLRLPMNLAAHSPDTLFFSLWDHVAQVELQINPWAEVYVNGERREPHAGEHTLLLLPGACELKFVHPQLGEKTETIVLRAGETRRLAINMF
ncbi:MAG: serine/threonine protein kinase [candidate division KSB1 bacterium]|nr:serine/threonine protein kinase [candidate division KSB1 bacterium]MDZ7273134.1 serine/threonine protein kinase [candidate division KSB1 bacterium]MDZ7285236.1 serine/threonine protein kinase [candidate division KSB1 bacterium]MDZ7298268.1 serine/threonine protein kinase [candidate division KSB1 bacterium]MDZ7308989.1 serine/threonine protein kinase [candidate division KSB1 bacterium]